MAAILDSIMQCESAFWSHHYADVPEKPDTKIMNSVENLFI